MFNILIAEDENDIRKMMCEYLQNNGFTVFEANNGEKAMDELDKVHIDLLITDIMMPKLNGYTLVRELREAKYEMPILMITAKETIEDKETGFNSGTDDYMVKPIVLREMLLRVNALLKRAKITNEKRIIVGNTTLDYEAFTVTNNKETFELPQKEFRLLFKLLSQPNRIFTRRQLMDEIWGYDSESGDSTVKVHISRLRERFNACKDFEIVTVKGLGYKAVER